MTNVKRFLKTYWPSILTVVVAFLTLLTAFKMLKVNFNPVIDKHIQKVVTVEAFDKSVPSIEDLASASNGSLHVQHEHCKQLKSLKAAGSSSTCVILDGKKAVGGSATGGPTFTTENGKPVSYDFYMHKGSCYGKCPK